MEASQPESINARVPGCLLSANILIRTVYHLLHDLQTVACSKVSRKKPQIDEMGSLDLGKEWEPNVTNTLDMDKIWHKLLKWEHV